MTDQSTTTAALSGRAWLLLLGCWITAAVASLGSLFFSEVLELPPCSMCWYQRVFMFSLAIVLMVGAMTADRHCTRYALPLAIGGWLFAGYHVLLHAGVVSESMAPCQQGVSCAKIQFQLFELLSIPVLSLLAFSTLVAGLLTLKLRYSR